MGVPATKDGAPWTAGVVVIVAVAVAAAVKAAATSVVDSSWLCSICFCFIEYIKKYA